MSIVTFQSKADRNRSKVCIVDPMRVNLADELKECWKNQLVQFFCLEKNGIFPPLSDMFVYGVDSMDVELRCFPITDFIGYKMSTMRLPDGVQVQVLDHIRPKHKEYQLNIWEKEWQNVEEEFESDLRVMHSCEEFSDDPVLKDNQRRLVDEIKGTSTVFRRKFIRMEAKNCPPETDVFDDYRYIQLDIYEFDNHAPVVVGCDLTDDGSRRCIPRHTRDMYKFDETKEVFYDGGARYTYDYEKKLLTIDLLESAIEGELEYIFSSSFRDESGKSFSIEPTMLVMAFLASKLYQKDCLLATSLRNQTGFIQNNYFLWAIQKGLKMKTEGK